MPRLVSGQAQPASGLAACNPVAKLAAATILAVALVLTLDPVTSTVVLAGELGVLPWAGLAPRALWRRCRLVLAGAVSSAALTLVFAPHTGASLAGPGPLALSTGSIASAASVGLRIAAIGVPGVVLLATTDPTDLADALAQRAHAPERVVLAALAAARLVDVLVDEWQMIGLARRARGFGGDHGARRLLAAPGEIAARTFALTVAALRRASILATAMEARGFGVDAPRTWARTSPLAARDGLLVAAAVLLASTATGVALLAGSWNLVLS